MSILSGSKVDKSFKNIQGVAYSTTQKQIFEEDAPTTPFLQSPDIYVQTAALPRPAVTASSGLATFYPIPPSTASFTMVNDSSTTSGLSWYASTDGTNLTTMRNTRVGNWVPPAIDPTYTVRVFRMAGSTPTEMFFSDAAGMLFDYKAGILSFDSSPLSLYPGTTGIKISGFVYIGLKLSDVITASGSISGSSLSALSGTVAATDIFIQNTVTALSGNLSGSISRLSASYLALSSSVAAFSGTVDARITALSGNLSGSISQLSASYLSLSSSVAALSSSVGVSIAVLSASVVHISGSETIVGPKTFSASLTASSDLVFSNNTDHTISVKKTTIPLGNGRNLSIYAGDSDSSGSGGTLALDAGVCTDHPGTFTNNGNVDIGFLNADMVRIDTEFQVGITAGQYITFSGAFRVSDQTRTILTSSNDAVNGGNTLLDSNGVLGLGVGSTKQIRLARTGIPVTASGLWDFIATPNVNGIPVLLSGSVGGFDPAVVHITGSETITGTKTFAGGLTASQGLFTNTIVPSADLTIGAGSGELKISNGMNQRFLGDAVLTANGNLTIRTSTGGTLSFGANGAANTSQINIGSSDNATLFAGRMIASGTLIISGSVVTSGSVAIGSGLSDQLAISASLVGPLTFYSGSDHTVSIGNATVGAGHSFVFRAADGALSSSGGGVGLRGGNSGFGGVTAGNITADVGSGSGGATNGSILLGSSATAGPVPYSIYLGQLGTTYLQLSANTIVIGESASQSISLAGQISSDINFGGPHSITTPFHAGTGNDLSIIPGDGQFTTSTGGNLYLKSGNGSSGANGANIYLVPGSGSVAGIVAVSGSARISGTLSVTGPISGSGDLVFANIFGARAIKISDAVSGSTPNGSNLSIDAARKSGSGTDGSIFIGYQSFWNGTTYIGQYGNGNVALGGNIAVGSDITDHISFGGQVVSSQLYCGSSFTVIVKQNDFSNSPGNILSLVGGKGNNQRGGAVRLTSGDADVGNFSAGPVEVDTGLSTGTGSAVVTIGPVNAKKIVFGNSASFTVNSGSLIVLGSASINGYVVDPGFTAPSTGQALVWNGSAYVPTSVVSSGAFDSSVVHLTGSETIIGQKTFTAPLTASGGLYSSIVDTLTATTLLIGTGSANAIVIGNSNANSSLTASANSFQLNVGTNGNISPIFTSDSGRNVTMPVTSINIKVGGTTQFSASSGQVISIGAGDIGITPGGNVSLGVNSSNMDIGGGSTSVVRILANSGVSGKTTDISGILKNNDGRRVNRTAKSDGQSLVVNNNHYVATGNASATSSLVVPGGSAAGTFFTVYDEALSADTKQINLTPSSGLINGVSRYQIDTKGGWASFISDGGSYYLVGSSRAQSVDVVSGTVNIATGSATGFSIGGAQIRLGTGSIQADRIYINSNPDGIIQDGSGSFDLARANQIFLTVYQNNNLDINGNRIQITAGGSDLSIFAGGVEQVKCGADGNLRLGAVGGGQVQIGADLTMGDHVIYGGLNNNSILELRGGKNGSPVSSSILIGVSGTYGGVTIGSGSTPVAASGSWKFLQNLSASADINFIRGLNHVIKIADAQAGQSGDQLNVQAGDVTDGQTGGTLYLRSGASQGGSSGDTFVTVGDSNGGIQGQVHIGQPNHKPQNIILDALGIIAVSGTLTPVGSISFDSSADHVIGVNQSVSGSGRFISIRGGNAAATGGDAGNIYIDAGQAFGTGSLGLINIGASNNLTNTAVILIGNGNQMTSMTLGTGSIPVAASGSWSFERILTLASNLSFTSGTTHTISPAAQGGTNQVANDFFIKGGNSSGNALGGFIFLDAGDSPTGTKGRVSIGTQGTSNEVRMGVAGSTPINMVGYVTGLQFAPVGFTLRVASTGSGGGGDLLIRAGDTGDNSTAGYLILDGGDSATGTDGQVRVGTNGTTSAVRIGRSASPACPTFIDSAATTVAGTASFTNPVTVHGVVVDPGFTTPTDGQVLVYVAASGGFIPGVASGSGGGSGTTTQFLSASSDVFDVQLTTTAPTTLATHTPATPGNYLVHFYFRAVGTTTLSASVNWSDGSGPQTQVLVASSSYSTNSYPVFPVYISAQTASISVVANAGTANNIYVSTSIVRI